MLKSLRAHIGIFGQRNIGKSSFINSLSEEEVSIVSSTPGTTTDAVKKQLEFEGVGPVVLIDTAGIDDIGNLGSKRIKAALKVLESIDFAILLIENNLFSQREKDLIKQFKSYRIPYIIIHNKCDIIPLKEKLKNEIKSKYGQEILSYSCTSYHRKLKETVINSIRKHMPESTYQNPTMLGDIVNCGDIVLMVVPIDTEAPQGRLILPQVQAIRDVLDNDCIVIVLKDKELELFFNKYSIKPKMVVTDSQVFLKVHNSIPNDIFLTSFSILLSRIKGDFYRYIQGTRNIEALQNNDHVLILESCSHHVTDDDIGRIKIPRWLSNFTQKKLEFDIVSGLNNLPKPIENYSLVVQCGGCMFTRKQVLNRLKPAIDNSIPITNYGMIIAYVHGIFDRAVAPFTSSGTV